MDKLETVSDSLLASVVKHEGYRTVPYKDSLGIITVGHGLTWLSEPESLVVVKMRLTGIQVDLQRSIAHFDRLPANVQDCLSEMAFQLGTNGLLNFRNMLAAIRQQDYTLAGEHGLDSKWAKQTPERAEAMMTLLAATTTVTG